MRLLPALLLVACSGDATSTDTSSSPTGETGDTTVPTTDTTTTDPGCGSCGCPSWYDLTLIGSVRAPDGSAAVGTRVRLEDRGWAPGTVLGTAYADAEGRFEFTAPEVTSLDNCWGTLLNYVLVGERSAGAEYGEKDMNTYLYAAISDGTLVTDFTAFPLQLEETTTP